MTTSKRSRLAAFVGATLALGIALTIGTSATAPRFYDDDPIWHDRDSEDASSMKPLEVDLFVDLTMNMFARSAGDGSRARNVNTIGEVPDSSWYTNRAGHRALTPE